MEQYDATDPYVMLYTQKVITIKNDLNVYKLITFRKLIRLSNRQYLVNYGLHYPQIYQMHNCYLSKITEHKFKVIPQITVSK